MSDLDDEEFSAEELAEAEALARVLAGGRLDGAPSEALEAAALLRTARQPELSEARSQQMLDELLAKRPAPRAAAPTSLRWLRLAWLLVPAAAGGVVVWQVSQTANEAAHAVGASVTLPAPSRELLRLQAVALQGQQQAEYERELGAYRGEVLALLEAKVAR